MDGSSKPEPVTPGLGWTSATSGPLPSDPLKEDSILTAARLVRRGWTQEGKKTGLRFSYLDFSRQPSGPSSDGKQGPTPAEVCLTDPGSRRPPVMNTRKTAETDGSEKKMADEAKQTDGALSAYRQAGRQILYSQTGIRILVSGCHTTCRQSRRFKAPRLPVIAEV